MSSVEPTMMQVGGDTPAPAATSATSDRSSRRAKI